LQLKPRHGRRRYCRKRNKKKKYKCVKNYDGKENKLKIKK
jgi:hypothetical protein